MTTAVGDERIRKAARSKVGLKFNRLTCLSVFWDTASNSTHGRFLCDCGNTYSVRLAAVLSGNTKSCGCLAKDILEARNVKHGMARTKIYSIWADMIGRCHRPSHARYEDYGGRGITVAAEWHNFERFYADMGERPEGRSLDRIKNHLGYSKANCRWATLSEQATNKRNNRWVEAFGLSFPITWWGQLVGMGSSQLNTKLKKFTMEDIAIQRVGQDGVDYLCLR